ncbi:hypothetical protein D3C75_1141910 [compost metagenome]
MAGIALGVHIVNELQTVLAAVLVLRVQGNYAEVPSGAVGVIQQLIAALVVFEGVNNQRIRIRQCIDDIDLNRLIQLTSVLRV